MNVTNTKLEDVRQAFAALPPKGRDVKFDGKVATNIDPNTHIQGLAPFRSFHFLTHSVYGEPAGRLLVASRAPGSEGLVAEVTLPTLSQTKPYFFHPGGCQVIGDCLVVPIENGEGASFITFFDASDPKDVREVSPASRIRRSVDAGSVGVSNFTETGKDYWLLCAYDNGRADFYLSQDQDFPGTFKVIFSTSFDETELQSLCLLTDVSDAIFAIGLHRTLAGRDMATLFSVDLAKKKVEAISQRHLKTSGPDDPIGGGPHFRWGAGVEIVSATEIALFCSGRRYDSGCHINAFDSPTRSARVLRRRRGTGRTTPTGRKRARLKT